MSEINPVEIQHAMPEGHYWHFLPASRALQYGDNRSVKVGETLAVTGKPILCEHGLHACKRAIDALHYAPGPVICLVTLGGIVVHGGDKSAGQERTAVWILDADRLLREFACDVAEIALLGERKVGREPDPRSWAAIEVMRRFMRGEATEDEWDAASAAAWAAASAAARDAAWAAASAATRAAASAAARDAASAAARDAAWDDFNDRLTQMLLSARARGQGEFVPAEREAVRHD